MVSCASPPPYQLFIAQKIKYPPAPVLDQGMVRRTASGLFEIVQSSAVEPSRVASPLFFLLDSGLRRLVRGLASEITVSFGLVPKVDYWAGTGFGLSVTGHHTLCDVGTQPSSSVLITYIVRGPNRKARWETVVTSGFLGNGEPKHRCLSESRIN